MIAIDAKMPAMCGDCMFKELVEHGVYRGEWMCRVMEMKGLSFSRCMVNLAKLERPENCPLMEVKEYGDGSGEKA